MAGKNFKLPKIGRKNSEIKPKKTAKPLIYLKQAIALKYKISQNNFKKTIFL